MCYCLTKKIDFVIPPELHKLSLLCSYSHSLDFLINSQVNDLHFFGGGTEALLDSIPLTIHILKITYLWKPLINLPYKIKRITIVDFKDTDLLFKSKFPHDCEVFYGYNMQKYIE